MTARKAQARLTKADERAIARLLAEDDDREVVKLAVAINHYEATAANAKARLTKRKVGTPCEFYWHGGYRAAMATVLDMYREMVELSRSSRDILHAVLEVAASAEDLAFGVAESTAESWSGSES